MKPHNSQKEGRKFISVVNYQHDMWPRTSHTLVSLPQITSYKNKFKWTKIKLDAFVEIKRIMNRNTLLTYLDFIEAFKIHANASYFQL